MKARSRGKVANQKSISLSLSLFLTQMEVNGARHGCVVGTAFALRALEAVKDNSRRVLCNARKPLAAMTTPFCRWRCLVMRRDLLSGNSRPLQSLSKW
jgi:hypothetical protein